MKKNVLLKMFKDANPRLLALSPKIIVEEVKEKLNCSKGQSKYYTYDPPLLQITIKHPFIFDNRLVPDEFQGIEVLNVTIGGFPKEFPEPSTDHEPLEEHYAPERYINFVNRSITQIRKKLKNPDLSKEEALDAITGGFEKHINWCEQLSEKNKRENT